jgi:hypothetical protein
MLKFQKLGGKSIKKGLRPFKKGPKKGPENEWNFDGQDSSNRL